MHFVYDKTNDMFGVTWQKFVKRETLNTDSLEGHKLQSLQ